MSSLYGTGDIEEVEDIEADIEVEDESRHYTDNSQQVIDQRILDESVDIVDTSITDTSTRDTSITDTRIQNSTQYTNDTSSEASADLNVNVSGSGNYVNAQHMGIQIGDIMGENKNQMKILGAFVVLLLIIVGVWMYIRSS